MRFRVDELDLDLRSNPEWRSQTKDGLLVRHKKTAASLPPIQTPLTVPLTLAAAAALVTFAWVIGPSFRLSQLTASLSDKQAAAKNPIRDQTARRVARASFYDNTVSPLIVEVDAENRAAADRCLRRIDRVLQGYHAGVERFVDDMTSISTRLGVLKRMPGGWWASDGRVEAYVQQKFETHLFSEQRLVDDVSAALLQFRGDVDANQKRMLTQVQAALSTADLPGVPIGYQHEFFHDLATRLGGYAADQGTVSVENMLGALVLGEVGAFAARSVVAGLLVRFAPSAAISSAAGASAAVGASATGAGGGSLGGPVGAVVGFGAGLAIGLVIDWWMTERFEAELSRQLHLYLDDLESTLLDAGGSADAVTMLPAKTRFAPRGSGLQDALPRICDQLRDAYRDRFFYQIVDGESS
jgi:hypothetical protein